MGRHESEQADWDGIRAQALASLSSDGQRMVGQVASQLGDLNHTDNQSVEQIVSGIAHDFNNLLGVVQSTLELFGQRFEQTAVPPRERDHLDRAMIATARGAALMRQMAALARRETLPVMVLDPNQLIRDAESLLRSTLEPKIQWRTKLAPDLWPIMADAAQFDTAILNLVLNARDAMPDGGQLTIKTSNVVFDSGFDNSGRPSHYAAITVSDNGTGMSDVVRASAFEPYFTTKAEGKGTGLGLSQVQAFARRFQGFVTLQSSLGQGTAVTILLPPQGSVLAQAAQEGVSAPLRANRGAGAVAAKKGDIVP